MKIATDLIQLWYQDVSVGSPAASNLSAELAQLLLRAPAGL
jgi:hypothetical protein